jgi:hypothetical protein
MTLLMRLAGAREGAVCTLPSALLAGPVGESAPAQAAATATKLDAKRQPLSVRAFTPQDLPLFQRSGTARSPLRSRTNDDFMAGVLCGIALQKGPMGLRRAADIRTLMWCAAMPVVVFAQYARPDLIRYLWPLSFYFAMAAGTIAHNHNHVPTF